MALKYSARSSSTRPCADHPIRCPARSSVGGSRLSLDPPNYFWGTEEVVVSGRQSMPPTSFRDVTSDQGVTRQRLRSGDRSGSGWDLAVHPKERGSGSRRQCPKAVEACRPFGSPRPCGRQVKLHSSRSPREATGDGEEFPPDGLHHDWAMVLESKPCSGASPVLLVTGRLVGRRGRPGSSDPVRRTGFPQRPGRSAPGWP